MTRINVIPVHELHTKHLVAEYRELPRVFALILAAQMRGETPATINAPKEYVLGTGHVKFFYDKVLYLARRFDQLVTEMLHRGYNPKYLDVRSKMFGIDQMWMNDWKPPYAALRLSRKRITERLEIMLNGER